MAATDFVPGQCRVIKTVRLGHTKVVVGPLVGSETDKAASYPIILNPEDGRNYASGMRLVHAPLAVFNPGEIIEIQWNATALAEAINFDDDEFFIDCIEEDLNTKDLRTRTLNVADTELAADPSTIVGTFVTFWKYTIPARTKITLAGAFKASANEHA